MKQIILALLLSYAFCSCGSFKKSLNKTKEQEKTVSEVKTVTTETVTEVLDTTITTKPDSVTATGTIKDLEEGKTIEAETDGVKVEVKVDPITKKVTAKAVAKKKEIPVSGKRTIQRKTVQDARQTATRKTSKKTVLKEREPGINMFLLGAGVSILIGFGVIIFYFRRRRSERDGYPPRRR